MFTPPSSPASPTSARFGVFGLTYRQALYGLAGLLTLDVAGLAFVPRLVNVASDLGLVVLLGAALAAIVAHVDIAITLRRHRRAG